jgi:FAD/FMN-containing dehydrogenase
MKVLPDKARCGEVLTRRAIDEFLAVFDGAIVEPDQSAPASSFHGPEFASDKVRKLIIVCLTPHDVAKSVHFALAYHMDVSLRINGRIVSGQADRDAGIVIDVSGLKSIVIDRSQTVVRVGSGATIAELDKLTGALGLVVPIGASTGSIVLSAGVGWLSQGLEAPDHPIIGLQVVTPDGLTRIVDTRLDARLFQEILAGHHDRGVVTAFFLYVQPYRAVFDCRAHRQNFHAGNLLRLYREFMRIESDTTSVFYAMLRS